MKAQDNPAGTPVDKWFDAIGVLMKSNVLPDVFVVSQHVMGGALFSFGKFISKPQYRCQP